MKSIVQKLVHAEREMAQEKGCLLLFALFLREDAPDLWDLIVSAPWASENKSESLNYIARKIRDALSDEELLKLSRIVIIEQDNPALEVLNRTIEIEHGILEILNNNFLGLQIKQGFIITSRKNESPPFNSGQLIPDTPSSIADL